MISEPLYDTDPDKFRSVAIAAYDALNSAGYDGQAAIEALPELVAELERLRGSGLLPSGGNSLRRVVPLLARIRRSEQHGETDSHPQRREMEE